MSMMLQSGRFAASGPALPSPPVNGPHRYWRMTCMVSPSFCMMNKIEIYDAGGLTDYMQTATITSTTPQDGSIANLLDTDTNHYCQFHDDTFFIRWDMGSDVQVEQVKIQGGGFGNYIDRAPQFFIWEYSDDDTTYTQLFVGAGDGEWVDYSTPLVFQLPVSIGSGASSWGIQANTVQNDSRGILSVATLDMRSSTGGSNLATGVSNPAGSHAFNGSFAPGKAFDGDATSFFSMGSGWGKPFFLVATLSAPAIITEIAVTARDDFGSADEPKTGWVLFSTDGHTYFPYWAFEFPDWTVTGETKVTDKA